MADLRGFDAATIEPRKNFEPIPAGKYIAAITESEMKPNKAGTGSYLKLTFQVIEGTYKGRLLWARLNLNNPNATAVQIARESPVLAIICLPHRPSPSRSFHLPRNSRAQRVVDHSADHALHKRTLRHRTFERNFLGPPCPASEGEFPPSPEQRRLPFTFGRIGEGARFRRYPSPPSHRCVDTGLDRAVSWVVVLSHLLRQRICHCCNADCGCATTGPVVELTHLLLPPHS